MKRVHSFIYCLIVPFVLFVLSPLKAAYSCGLGGSETFEPWICTSWFVVVGVLSDECLSRFVGCYEIVTALMMVGLDVRVIR